MRRVQGKTAGWRPIAKALPASPVRLIQISLAALKARQQARAAAHRIAHRLHVTVRTANTLVVQDATHVGRVAGQACQAEILKDRASLTSLIVTVGAAATSEEILQGLERLKHTTGLPLVWGTDNGPAYRNAAVETYLSRERVVHLRSQPHTPQDNAAAERAIGELKAEAKLGKGVVLRNADDAMARLETARGTLNHGRWRASLGYQTSAQQAARLSTWETKVSREAFYQRVQQAQEAAGQGAMTARERLRAKRLAILETLEQYGLVELRRGQPVLAPVKAEDIS